MDDATQRMQCNELVSPAAHDGDSIPSHELAQRRQALPTAGCPSCSMIADGFGGFTVHLANHDVMLWAVSRAPTYTRDRPGMSAFVLGAYQWLDRAPKGRDDRGRRLSAFRRETAVFWPYFMASEMPFKDA